MFRLLCLETMALLSLVLQVCNDSLLIFILFFTKQKRVRRFPMLCLRDKLNDCSGNGRIGITWSFILNYYWSNESLQWTLLSIKGKVHILQPVLVTGSLVSFRSYNINSANIYHHLMIVICHNLFYNVCKRNMKHLMIF